jgi:hypothetical protein
MKKRQENLILSFGGYPLVEILMFAKPLILQNKKLKRNLLNREKWILMSFQNSKFYHTINNYLAMKNQIYSNLV